MNRDLAEELLFAAVLGVACAVTLFLLLEVPFAAFKGLLK